MKPHDTEVRAVIELHQPTLTICRGLPGSGKTYWAKERVDTANPPGSVIRVNRDDLREMALYNHYREPIADLEQIITRMQHAAIGAALHAGRDVISDDTNLRARYVRSLMEVALANGARWEICDFTDVPVEICIARDTDRVGRARVGAETIMRMHRQYLAQYHGKPLPVPELAPTALDPYAAVEPYVAPEYKPWAFLVDLDGTLALLNGRNPYDESCVGQDLPNRPVIEVAEALIERGMTPIYMSGRTEACREATEEWLREHLRPMAIHDGGLRLYMRPVGDTRPDHVVKLELFDRYVRHQWNVRFAIDDRNQVVTLWRRLGLVCFQAADGDF